FLTLWLEKAHVGAEGAAWSLSLPQRILIAGHAVWFYLDKLVCPVALTFNYPRWLVRADIWKLWLFPVAAIVGETGLWLARSRVGRGPVTAILFFIGTLGPSLGFVN